MVAHKYLFDKLYISSINVKPEKMRAYFPFINTIKHYLKNNIV
jgi:hypothetical protein